MKDWLFRKLVLSPRWSKLGKYMEPEINFVPAEDVPYGFGGYCRYNLFSCTIKIKDKYINDLGIQKHELAHARQYGRLWIIHSGLSMVWGTYNCFIELECYREQVKYYNYTSKEQYEWIIQALLNKYKTGMNEDEIRRYADMAFKDLI